jgi:hypothetical protein
MSRDRPRNKVEQGKESSMVGVSLARFRCRHRIPPIVRSLHQVHARAVERSATSWLVGSCEGRAQGLYA